MEKLKGRPNLPELEIFKHQFEQKYGRKMTPDEARMFSYIEKLLLHPPEEENENSEQASADD